ncbi:MAG: PKD domain-containing protein [Acidobacteriota bacterium]|nr:PKD domain-containing protein [Acidobacteriota bacterium]
MAQNKPPGLSRGTVCLLHLLMGIFLQFLTPVILGAQTNLSQTPNKVSDLPFVIVRPNGEVMVAWTEGDFNSSGVIVYRILTDSGGWSPIRIAVSPERGSASLPTMAIDGRGDVHMSYMDGSGSTNREIYYIKYANGTWGKREMVYFSYLTNSSWPRIDVDGNRIYIVWGHNHTTDAHERKIDIVMMEKIDGGSWPSTYRSVSETPNSVSIHSFVKVRNGNVHVAWMDDLHSPYNWNIYYRERIGGSWNSRVHVSPDWNQYVPAMTIDQNGTVHLIFTYRSNPVYYMRKPLNGNWTSPIAISTASTSVFSFVFIKYHANMLHAVWRQSHGSGEYIYYSRGNLNGQWETPVKVSHAGEGEFPALDIDGRGRVHVVYSDINSNGNRDVFHVRLDQVSTYPIASFTASPMQGPPPLNVAFDASNSYDPDGSIVSYSWKFGDGSQGSGKKVSHTYTKSGLFTAQLTVTDNEGKTGTNSTTIMVGQQPVALFTASPTSGGAPLKVDFDATASNDPNNGSIVSYKWDFGDESSGQGKTISHVYHKTGTFTATLTVKNDAGLEASTSIQIRVSIMPTAIFKTHPFRGEMPLVVHFDASSSKPSESEGSIISYDWVFGDGKTGSGRTVSHTYRNHGAYKATLTITDDKGRKASNSSHAIEVLAPPVAAFTATPKKGVAPLSVTFNASESSDPDGWIETYKWDLGDGNHILHQAKTLKHTYTRGGEIAVRLTVIDNDGLYRSTSQSIEILYNPFPPTKLSLQKAVFEGLYFSNHINILSWEGNSQNDGFFHIVKHRIYRKKKGESDAAFVLIKEGPGTVFKYEDGGLGSVKNMESYVYGIAFIDERNRESLKTHVSHPDTAASHTEPMRIDPVRGKKTVLR